MSASVLLVFCLCHHSERNLFECLSNIHALVCAESHLDQWHKGQGIHPSRPAPAAVRATSGDLQHRSPSQEDEIRGESLCSDVCPNWPSVCLLTRIAPLKSGNDFSFASFFLWLHVSQQRSFFKNESSDICKNRHNLRRRMGVCSTKAEPGTKKNHSL